MMKQPRQHCEKHLRFIRGLPCCVCHDNTTTEAAHVRYASPENGKRYVGKGEKPDDRWCVPLCGRHHRDQHEIGEREFWLRVGIDPIQLAVDLWASRGDFAEAERIALNANRVVNVV
jgi:hypothetical protein